jgi:class 3 adenylate cyclase/tetratricopeptide (TPR) repeat protein
MERKFCCLTGLIDSVRLFDARSRRADVPSTLRMENGDMAIDVAEWLQKLGLDQYAIAFAKNDLNEGILPAVTADDLAAIGVTSVGHRRRLLLAIAALSDGDAAIKLAPPVAAAAPASEAERRQLTVMFCDLVGSTALASKFDPEDLRAVLAGYHRCVADTVARFAGFVAKYMGDGVLIYFGYPQAHEDDAERAVRAGLAVLDSVRQLAAPVRLQARIGIATGLAVVGDLIGEGAAQERGVVGETPNLAARLQGLAGPDGLVIADTTRQQIGTMFELEDIGPQSLAGFAEPLPAWRVFGESGVVSRFEALRSAATPLVGRDEERDQIVRRWQQAKGGEGRVVLLSAEAGFGKSRLTAAVVDAVSDEPHTRLRWFCSPHHQDSALFPVIVQLEHAAGFARGDTSDEKLGKLRHVVDVGSEDQFELLAELLSLPNSAVALNMSIQRKREELFETLLRQLMVLARQRPVVAVFEDVHWIDPTSRELLDLMIDRVPTMSVLLIVTARPEFQANRTGQPHVTMLALNRLGDREAAALAKGLAGNVPLPSEVLEEIIERTDGVPLFVEELTKAVLELSDKDRVATVLSASPVAALAVPATLHAALISRLDRLGSVAREIAQIGATLGREFSYELIDGVARRPEPELRAALSQLSEAGLLFHRGMPPASSYTFNHALVQDAAYSTLLHSRRQELHARAAAVLSQNFTELVERQPELLAHHLTAAGDNERAVEQWLKAGQYAASRLAYREAVSHLERGLSTLRSLSDSVARDRQEIDLRLSLGLCLFTSAGAVAALPAYARAQELADKQGSFQQRFEALFGVWQCNTVSGGVVAARPFSEQLLRMTGSEQDSGLRLQAHHSGWSTYVFIGEPSRARALADAGRALYNPEKHHAHRLIYGGHDPGICARYIGGWAEWLLGYPDKALASIDESLALADRVAHPFTSLATLYFAFAVHISNRQPDEVLKRLDVAEVFAAEQRLSFMVEPEIMRGAALVVSGAVDEATDLIRQGLIKTRRNGTTFFLPFGLASLADALVRRGEYTAALAAAQEGLEVAEATGQHVWDAELHRLSGVASLVGNKIDESQTYFGKALAVARRHQARAYELRAATSVARLWAEQGRRAQACELLAPIYGWFTEGFNTADLKDAETLLDEIA